MCGIQFLFNLGTKDQNDGWDEILLGKCSDPLKEDQSDSNVAGVEAGAQKCMSNNSKGKKFWDSKFAEKIFSVLNLP